jgi:hypothetical protein
VKFNETQSMAPGTLCNVGTSSASWFETREGALLTTRGETSS